MIAISKISNKIIGSIFDILSLEPSVDTLNTMCTTGVQSLNIIYYNVWKSESYINNQFSKICFDVCDWSFEWYAGTQNKPRKLVASWIGQLRETCTTELQYKYGLSSNRHSRICMVVGFTSTYAISAYQVTLKLWV